MLRRHTTMRVLAVLAALAIAAAACSQERAAEPTTFEPSEGTGREPADANAPTAALANGFNEAGFALWRTQPAAENFVFSPASIGHALLMARAAADDVTAAAIDDGLRLPAGNDAHAAWNAIDQAVAAAAEAEDELTIRAADRIWPRLDVSPGQGWIDLLAAFHGTTVEALDFAGDPSGSREVINEWVSEQTMDLIPDLLPEGFIGPDTVLVLTDALYFKARWQRVFGKYGPVTDTFTLLDGTSVETDYLLEFELTDLRGAGEGWTAAEIPYVGGEFSMLVVVPDDFAVMRERLDASLIAQIDAALTTGPYELQIPQWETTTSLDLLPWLNEMGAAPGSYPLITPAAFLDGAVHGADIAVDEWGTVAAAATGFGFVESGPPDPELVVHADRPFFYLIRHRASGLVLFAGQVTNPNE